MTDKELLELAATAAGIDTSKVGAISGLYLGVYGWWNPLTDDGDALRLAVKLNLLNKRNIGYPWPDDISELRRAIVHAAAEIGKEIK